MADAIAPNVQAGLATLTATGWDVIEPSEGGRFGPSVSGVGNARLGPNILEFKSTDGWTDIFGGNTITYPTTNTFRASQALAITPASTSQGVRKNLASTIRIATGTLIQLVVWIPESFADAGTTPTIQLKLSSDGNTSKSFIWTFSSNRLRCGGWNALTVRAGEDGSLDYDGSTWAVANGEAWGNDFNYVHVLLGTLNGAGPILLDSISFGVKDVPRVVFTFDNVNDTSLLNFIAPSLAQYGWAAGLMLDSDQIAPNIATIRTLRDTYGWDIGSMGGPGHINYRSTPGSGSAARLAADLPLVYAAHAANGLSRPTSFAFPGNQHNAACDALLAAEGFTFRRSWGEDILQNGGGSSIPRSLGSLVRCGQTSLGTTFATTKARIDALCQVTGGLLSLWTHGVFTSGALIASPGGTDVSTWYQDIDYLGQMKRTYGLECIKPNEVATKLNGTRRY